MDLKNQLTKTPYLVLFIVLISIGVGTASALAVYTFSGNVVITGDLDVDGDIDTIGDIFAGDVFFGKGNFVGNTTLGGEVTIEENLDMTNGKITNLANPTNPSDATTKSYVDSTNVVAKNIEVLESSGNTGAYTSLDIGVDGFPVISYYSITAESLRFIHCTSIDCSTHDTPLTLDNSANVGLYTSIAIGGDGFPVVTYHDSTNGKLKFIHCTSINCSTKDPALILDDGGQFSSIKINSSGFPLIAHYDPASNNGDLKYIFCNLPTCSDLGGNQKITLDDSNNDSDNEGSHLAMSKNTQQPQIVYADSTNDDTRLIECANATCSIRENQNIGIGSGAGDFYSIVESSDGKILFAVRDGTELDLISCTKTDISICEISGRGILDTSGNSIGINTQITIGSDGFPILAYHDTTIDVIKFIKCKNPSCGASYPAVIVDNGPNRVGSHISLAVGIDGNPVMAYRDFDADDLKFVHCADNRCIL